MNREDLVVGHIQKDLRGIEIGLWCNPLLVKREGFEVIILDVYPAEELHRRALVEFGLPEACTEAGFNLWNGLFPTYCRGCRKTHRNAPRLVTEHIS